MPRRRPTLDYQTPAHAAPDRCRGTGPARDVSLMLCVASAVVYAAGQAAEAGGTGPMLLRVAAGAGTLAFGAGFVLARAPS